MNIYNKCSSYKLNIKKAQYGNHSHDSKQVSPGHLLCWSILSSCHTVNDVKPKPFLQKMVSWRCPMTFLNYSLHIVVHLGHIKYFFAKNMGKFYFALHSILGAELIILCTLFIIICAWHNLLSFACYDNYMHICAQKIICQAQENIHCPHKIILYYYFLERKNFCAPNLPLYVLNWLI